MDPVFWDRSFGCAERGEDGGRGHGGAPSGPKPVVTGRACRSHGAAASGTVDPGGSRPAGPLARRGLRRCTRVLGLDDAGREILEYIPGEMAWDERHHQL